jgi:hypothetical protein
MRIGSEFECPDPEAGSGHGYRQTNIVPPPKKKKKRNFMFEKFSAGLEATPGA